MPFDLPGLEKVQGISAEAAVYVLLLKSDVEMMLIPLQGLTRRGQK
jgi:hypothetical protein